MIMTQNQQTWLQKKLPRNWLAGVLLLAACHQPSPAPPAERHLAMVSWAGSSISIDKADNRSVMRTEPAPGAATVFSSFLVRWEDSLAGTDRKRDLEREKYFQYHMQKDWVALINGDSLYPVFFQGKPELNRQRKEGVMVFEIPSDRQPDTLVYKDSFTSGGAQLFVLNRK
jgi:hypothetical protein